ncbi:MAG: NAD+ synthase [Promethearchaeota archaeon]|jgi:NAD+ synthase
MRTLDYDLTISKIQNWIRKFAKSVQIEGIVVGLSGGIDSAVTSSLCVNAIGKENVIGLGLPCLSIPQDLNDAKMLAEQLGIKFLIIDLSSVYEEYLKITSDKIESNIIAKANLKARLRMLSYYFVGQSMGNFLVGGTSNRTELAIGYFTKYGDGGVDFEPIGGLYKCEVREIAKKLRVPAVIITKPPSAGLWEGQTDEGEIGITYDEIDEIIYRMDYDLDLSNLNQKNIKKVKEMMKAAQHKLKMPPLYEISKEEYE